MVYKNLNVEQRIFDTAHLIELCNGKMDKIKILENADK
jgi:hypothetical protein